MYTNKVSLPQNWKFCKDITDTGFGAVQHRLPVVEGSLHLALNESFIWDNL